MLNPTFGIASQAVQGADADYMIDDTLVDIKTTKTCAISSSQLHQLVGYRILLAACEPNGSHTQGEPSITHAAIYFSRHAYLARFPYRNVICVEDFKKLGGWLIHRITASHDESRPLLDALKQAAF